MEKQTGKSATKKTATRKTATKKTAAKEKKVAAEPGKSAKEAAPAKASAPPAPETDASGLTWVDAGGGYALALVEGKLVARNEKGKKLSSVPKQLGDGEVAEQLTALRDWLKAHDKSCVETVDTWMLRSLPVPRAVLESVWADPSWRAPLENAVVAVSDEAGRLDPASAGFLKGVDAKKGVGVVNLDGETQWLDEKLVAIPHPILLKELADLRELATELSLTQGISQLFRETFARAKTVDPRSKSLTSYADGKFAQLNHALGKCRTLGYRVRGGFATCPVYEGGKRIEARFWIGADYPEGETLTGDLLWVDGKELTLPFSEVGPVAWSEGIRMASAIHAARVVEKQQEQ